ncbi:hypothetical protein D3C80_2057400 [compost metagenome]
MQGRGPCHRLRAGGGPVLVTDRNIELGEGEIPAGAVDDIVEMVGAANDGFGEVATENILHHKSCNAALSPGWVFSRPQAAGFE